MSTTDPAPQESKPRKRAERPADAAHANLRASRSRLAGDRLRVSLSEATTAEAIKAREQFREGGQSPALVDQAIDDAIESALGGKIMFLAVTKLKASLAGFLGERGASGAEGG